MGINIIKNLLEKPLKKYLNVFKVCHKFIYYIKLALMTSTSNDQSNNEDTKSSWLTFQLKHNWDCQGCKKANKAQCFYEITHLRTILLNFGDPMLRTCQTLTTLSR